MQKSDPKRIGFYLGVIRKDIFPFSSFDQASFMSFFLRVFLFEKKTSSSGASNKGNYPDEQ